MANPLTVNPKYKAAREIVVKLRGAGHQAYFAGGCVRDMLLGVAPKDFDVATSATPERDTLSLLGPTDTLGIVTVHDGAPIAHGEIIAPEIEAMESGLDHHYFQDPHTYFRKRVLVVGGKNSAVEAALRCHNVGAEVTISYRREQLNPSSIKYWLLPEINGLLEAGKIRGYFGSEPTEITPSHVSFCRSRFCQTNDGRAYEPQPFLFKLLQRNIACNHFANVEARNFACGSERGEISFSIGINGSVVAGVDATGAQESGDDMEEEAHRTQRGKAVVKVPLTTLDEDLASVLGL